MSLKTTFRKDNRPYDNHIFAKSSILDVWQSSQYVFVSANIKVKSPLLSYTRLLQNKKASKRNGIISSKTVSQ